MIANKKYKTMVCRHY